MADMETEAEEKCRVCEDCHKAFNTQMDFEVHLCCQTMKCPLLCNFEIEHCTSIHCCLCGKKFNRLEILKDHKKTNHREKPHTCPHCQFRSITANYLRAHIVRKHTKEFQHFCSFCSKGHVHKSELLRHIQKAHPSEKTDDSVVKKEKGEAADERTVANLLVTSTMLEPTDSQIKGATTYDDIGLPASQMPEAAHFGLPSSTPMRSETQRVALTVRRGLKRVPLRKTNKRIPNASEKALKTLVRDAKRRRAALAEQVERRRAEAEKRLHNMELEHQATMRMYEAIMKAYVAKRIYYETLTKLL